VVWDWYRGLERRLTDGDSRFARANRRGYRLKMAQYRWAGRNWLLILVLSAVGIALVIRFGR
jgi:hypothetical protein